MSVDPERLMAYVDGELDEDGRREVAEALAADPGLRDELERQARLKQMLSGHYGPIAAEEVPDRLLALLGAGKAEGVESLAEARARSKARVSTPQRFRQWGAVAASLAVGLLAGQLLPPLRGGGPARIEDRTLVAGNGLGHALETQLASAQSAAAPVRIGVTFADRQGRACRTFEAQAFSGIACREGGDWTLVATEASERASVGEYRQAGSPALMGRAQEMMADAPMDAAQERAALRAGWKLSRD